MIVEQISIYIGRVSLDHIIVCHLAIYIYIYIYIVYIAITSKNIIVKGIQK